jgi:acetyltransferase
VALKLHSETITHKTEVGGVQLNLQNEAAVRSAYRSIQASVAERAGANHFQGVTVQKMIGTGGYQLILGSSLDPQFGPVLLFGAGGQLVEVFRDRALALPPLNTTLARRLMEQTRIFRALQGVRGRKPVDMAGLDQLLVRFSHLVAEQPWIREIDINPLLASEDRLLALDARIILHGPEMRPEDLPKLAIRPYPNQYAGWWTMKTGELVTIRPIRPEDEPMMVRFHETLSERSVYFRYFHLVNLSQRVAHERLTRICFIDYDRQIALVAERSAKDAGATSAANEIMGVARLTRLRGTDAAECAVLVSDRFQNQGVGSELLSRILDVARAEGVHLVTAEILSENPAMHHICRRLGFRLHQSVQNDVVKADIAL